MDLELKGSVAVVVGGAMGIGRVVAEAFAAEGASVACVDRDESVGGVAEELASTHGVKTVGLVADITDYPRMQEVAGEVELSLGAYHHVVCTAAIGSHKYRFPFWNLQPGDWDKVLQINITGTVNVAHAFSPKMIEWRSGSFLFYSSVAGQIGSQTDPPYSASKAGVINFAQCAAKDLAEYGVRVNCLCPGMVKSDLNRSVWEAWTKTQPDDTSAMTYEEWAGEKIRKVCPLGIWQEPEDLAAMSVFLASPRARVVTGQTINVDGGFVMHW